MAAGRPLLSLTPSPAPPSSAPQPSRRRQRQRCAGPASRPPRAAVSRGAATRDGSVTQPACKQSRPLCCPTLSALSVCPRSTRMAPFSKLCRARWKGFASGIRRAGGANRQNTWPCESCDSHATTHPPACPAGPPWCGRGSRAGPSTGTSPPLPSSAPQRSSGGTPSACTPGSAWAQHHMTPPHHWHREDSPAAHRTSQDCCLSSSQACHTGGTGLCSGAGRPSNLL